MYQDLTPAEALMVLHGPKTKPSEAIKVTLLSLFAQGVLRHVTLSKPGLFGRREVAGVVTTGIVPRPGGPHVDAIIEVARRNAAKGGNLDGLIDGLRQAFGSGFKRFLTDHVAPGLIARGLIRLRRRSFLGLALAPVVEWTPLGDAERARIAVQVERTPEVQHLLRHDPSQAAALVLALGALIFLMPALLPLYGDIARVMNRPTDGGGGDSSGGTDGASDDGRWWGGDTEIDTAALDSLGTAMVSFDAGFDAASDGGDGGDGGGGDGGGGGGD
jgi:hypothetical protein